MMSMFWDFRLKLNFIFLRFWGELNFVFDCSAGSVIRPKKTTH